MTFRFKSGYFVGYSVVQCSIEISSVPLSSNISTAACISSKVAIPVDRITFLFCFPIFSKYGRFVISPDGILYTGISVLIRKSSDSSSNGVENTSTPFSKQ